MNPNYCFLHSRHSIFDARKPLVEGPKHIAVISVAVAHMKKANSAGNIGVNQNPIHQLGSLDITEMIV